MKVIGSQNSELDAEDVRIIYFLKKGGDSRSPHFNIIPKRFYDFAVRSSRGRGAHIVGRGVLVLRLRAPGLSSKAAPARAPHPGPQPDRVCRTGPDACV